MNNLSYFLTFDGLSKESIIGKQMKNQFDKLNSQFKLRRQFLIDIITFFLRKIGMLYPEFKTQ